MCGADCLQKLKVTTKDNNTQYIKAEWQTQHLILNTFKKPKIQAAVQEKAEHSYRRTSKKQNVK